MGPRSYWDLEHGVWTQHNRWLLTKEGAQKGRAARSQVAH